MPNSGGTVSFKYDPFGRRIEKISPTATSIFVYDGDKLVETVNATGGEVASYARDQDIDEPLAMDRSGTVDYYQQDGLGSITSLTASTGSVSQSYTYDSFGNTTNSSGSLTNFFRYAGREFDTETNLYYYRARHYDPSTGRFLSEDPFKDVLRGLNFYAYVRNSPTNLIDPDGRTPVDWGWWGKFFNGAAWAQRIHGAVNWGFWEVDCMLCTAFQTRQDMDRAMGNSADGYINNMVNQYNQTGSGDAGYNQHVMCTKGDPNCTKCEEGGKNLSIP